MSITEEIDQTDIEILKMLQDDCRITLDEMANKLKISKSTVYYRIKKLERLGIILGCHAKLSPEKMGKDYVAVILVKAKYGPGYHDKVGQKLAGINGVTAVYYIFGEWDFVLQVRASGKDEILRILEQIMNMEEVERTSTLIVAKVIKEDPRLPI
ncbi:Lrp/AsnC family transcriptional regulator [Vulcanisaeta distributa]|uniref:Transcriptional regulator, AsnC family n=1 Tax=Vulcanisaeta distributa (strain DSM 14429 / JCM 11212 / NBRC 100878 / IC-017) TaxID=572478 RepID=E1QPM8_VULDI|nr:Lrp/AsnC family transcriptional regulator [Vulcanisaeta distributa]ADN50324.1 transcriptional regulator, AsnC family [Vulcanisaeta distributa DSM 14429]